LLLRRRPRKKLPGFACRPCRSRRPGPPKKPPPRVCRNWRRQPSSGCGVSVGGG
jgi:hypothetical protein